MPDQGTILLVLSIIGGLTAAYAMWRTLRKIVHTFDAVEKAASRTTIAVEVILHQFSQNGGRLEQPLAEESVGRASVMDLLLDMRAYLRRSVASAIEHDRNAAERTEELKKAFKGE